MKDTVLRVGLEAHYLCLGESSSHGGLPKKQMLTKGGAQVPQVRVRAVRSTSDNNLQSWVLP